MRATILQPPAKQWECPSCGAEHVSRNANPHMPLHPCPKLLGIMTPFVEKGGLKSRHVLVERGDYVGTEDVQLFEGRPIMTLRTERSDGSNDARVFAPAATNRRDDV